MTANIENVEEWKRKRKSTFQTYIAQAFICGLGTTLFQTTAWDFINTLIKPTDRYMYYGVICSLSFVGSLLFGTCICSKIDRTKRVRSSMVIMNIVLLFGTLIYMLPFGYIFPVVGRFLIGTLFIMRSVLYSELCRSYQSEELKRKTQVYVASATLGSCVGPLSNMIYLKADFEISNIQFLYGNASSFTLIILILAQIFFLLSFSFNVSKNVTSNISPLARNNTSKEPITENGSLKTEKKESKWTIILNLKFIILMTISFHSGLGMHFFRQALPLICEYLEYNKNIINWCIIGVELTSFISLRMVLRMKLNPKELYATGTVSIIAMMFHLFSLSLLDTKHPSAVNISLILASISTYAIFNVLSQTFIVVACKHLVPTDQKEFGESIRSVITILGRMSAAFIGAYLYKVVVLFVCMNSVWSLCMIAYINMKRFY